MNAITEDDVRRIVREEIVRALRYTSAEAKNYDGYEEPEIESRARDAMAQVLNGVVDRLPHADDCDEYLDDTDFVAKNNPQTAGDWLNRYRCSCGIDSEATAASSDED